MKATQQFKQTNNTYSVVHRTNIVKTTKYVFSNNQKNQAR